MQRSSRKSKRSKKFIRKVIRNCNRQNGSWNVSQRKCIISMIPKQSSKIIK